MTNKQTLSKLMLPTPIGDMSIIANDHGVVAIRWDTESDGHHPEAHNPVDRKLGQIVDVEAGDSPILDQAAVQLSEYFAGERTTFDLPLDPAGTDFQHQAWSALADIPFGETISYGEQANAMGDRNKARAVGAANGQNPIPVVVPCHRVVGANGHLTGFAGGLEIKAWLLDHELQVRAG